MFNFSFAKNIPNVNRLITAVTKGAGAGPPAGPAVLSVVNTKSS